MHVITMLCVRACCVQFCVCMSKRKNTVFTAKHRKEDFGKKDYAVVVKIAITKMQSGVHLDLFPPRKKFITIVCSEKVKPVLTQVHLGDANPVHGNIQYVHDWKKVTDVWFSHIEQYFTQSA